MKQFNDVVCSDSNSRIVLTKDGVGSLERGRIPLVDLLQFLDELQQASKPRSNFWCTVLQRAGYTLEIENTKGVSQKHETRTVMTGLGDIEPV